MRVVVGPRDRDADVDLRREVVADRRLDPREELRLRLADVALDELDAVGKVLALPGRQVVQDHDVLAAGGERLRDVRADEAGSSGDEHRHARILSAVFVTFEGLDGSGTTTQTELLRQHLEEAGRDVVATREPGGTRARREDSRARARRDQISPWAEAALFAAATGRARRPR